MEKQHDGHFTRENVNHPSCPLDVEDSSEELLLQQSYAIKNQLEEQAKTRCASNTMKLSNMSHDALLDLDH